MRRLALTHFASTGRGGLASSRLHVDLRPHPTWPPSSPSSWSTAPGFLLSGRRRTYASDQPPRKELAAAELREGETYSQVANKEREKAKKENESDSESESDEVTGLLLENEEKKEGGEEKMGPLQSVVASIAETGTTPPPLGAPQPRFVRLEVRETDKSLCATLGCLAGQQGRS